MKTVSLSASRVTILTVFVHEEIQGDSYALAQRHGLVGCWMFHCRPKSAWADVNFGQLGNMVEYPYLSQTIPDLRVRTDESPCREIAFGGAGCHIEAVKE